MVIIRHATRFSDDPCHAIGFRLLVPPGMRVRESIPGLSLSLVWQGIDATVLAEVDLRVFPAPLLVDPAGVLDDALLHAAGDLIAEPRVGHVIDTDDIVLSNRRRHRYIATCLSVDENGELPQRPYQTVVVVPPPDRAIMAAVLVVTRSIDPSPMAAWQVLEGLKLKGMDSADSMELPVAS